MLDFIRHMAPELISNKKSATFDDSTLWKLIPSIGSIPSQVASQQSLSPFSPTGKCTLILADTVYFTLPWRTRRMPDKLIVRVNSALVNFRFCALNYFFVLNIL